MSSHRHTRAGTSAIEGDGCDLFGAIPLGYEAAVMGLGRNQCRWPIGHPDKTDFHFCPESQTTGKTLYCAGHEWDSRLVKRGKRPGAATAASARPTLCAKTPGIPPVLTIGATAGGDAVAVAVGGA